MDSRPPNPASRDAGASPGESAEEAQQLRRWFPNVKVNGLAQLKEQLRQGTISYYALFGVMDFESDVAVIEAAYERLMISVRNMQTGKHSALSQEILNTLSRLFALLCDAQKKQAYDTQLQAIQAQAQRPLPPSPATPVQPLRPGQPQVPGQPQGPGQPQVLGQPSIYGPGTPAPEMPVPGRIPPPVVAAPRFAPQPASAPAFDFARPHESGSGSTSSRLKKPAPIGLLVGGAAAVLLVVILGGLGVYFVTSSGTTNERPVAVNPSPNGDPRPVTPPSSVTPAPATTTSPATDPPGTTDLPGMNVTGPPTTIPTTNPLANPPVTNPPLTNPPITNAPVTNPPALDPARQAEQEQAFQRALAAAIPEVVETIGPEYDQARTDPKALSEILDVFLNIRDDEPPIRAAILKVCLDLCAEAGSPDALSQVLLAMESSPEWKQTGADFEAQTRSQAVQTLLKNARSPEARKQAALLADSSTALAEILRGDLLDLARDGDLPSIRQGLDIFQTEAASQGLEPAAVASTLSEVLTLLVDHTKSSEDQHREHRKPEHKAGLAQLALVMVPSALAARDYDTAGAFVAQADDLGKSLVGPTYLDLKREIKETREKLGRYREAHEKLATAPDDPAANLARAKELGLELGDWPGALAHLAKCGVSELETAARLTLAEEMAPNAASARARAWLAAMPSSPPDLKGLVQSAALAHYQDAFQSAEGLLKLEAKNKIDELIKQGTKERKFEGRTKAAGKLKTVDLCSLRPLVVEAPDGFLGFQEYGIQESRVAKIDPAELKGTPLKTFLFAHAPSRLEYELPAGAERFSALGYNLRSKSCRFLVYENDRLVFGSEAAGLASISVPLSGSAGKLALVVDEQGDFRNDQSFWINPVVTLRESVARPLREPLRDIDALSLKSLSATAPSDGIRFNNLDGRPGVLPPQLAALGGAPLRSYLFAHAPSRVEYEIPPGAVKFSAIGYCFRSTHVKFQVFENDRELFQSQRTGLVGIEVVLSGMPGKLALVIDAQGTASKDGLNEGASRDESFWVNPTFHAKSGPGLNVPTPGLPTPALPAPALPQPPLRTGQVDLLTISPVSAKNQLPGWLGFNTLGARGNETSVPKSEEIRGVPVKSYILAHASSWIEYKLPPGATRFTAIGYCTKSGSVKFKLHTNDQLLYESGLSGIVTINVNLPANTTKLVLEVDPAGDSDLDHSFWINPTLDFGSR